MFQTKVFDEIKTRISFNNFFLNLAFYEKILKKTSAQCQATDDNMVHVHCMLKK